MLIHLDTGTVTHVSDPLLLASPRPDSARRRARPLGRLRGAAGSRISPQKWLQGAIIAIVGITARILGHVHLPSNLWAPHVTEGSIFASKRRRLGYSAEGLSMLREPIPAAGEGLHEHVETDWKGANAEFRPNGARGSARPPAPDEEAAGDEPRRGEAVNISRVKTGPTEERRPA
jgi:hypothetical protein